MQKWVGTDLCPGVLPYNHDKDNKDISPDLDWIYKTQAYVYFARKSVDKGLELSIKTFLTKCHNQAGGYIYMWRVRVSLPYHARFKTMHILSYSTWLRSYMKYRATVKVLSSFEKKIGIYYVLHVLPAKLYMINDWYFGDEILFSWTWIYDKKTERLEGYTPHLNSYQILHHFKVVWSIYFWSGKAESVRRSNPKQSAFLALDTCLY